MTARRKESAESIIMHRARRTTRAGSHTRRHHDGRTRRRTVTPTTTGRGAAAAARHVLEGCWRCARAQALPARRGALATTSRQIDHTTATRTARAGQTTAAGQLQSVCRDTFAHELQRSVAASRAETSEQILGHLPVGRHCLVASIVGEAAPHALVCVAGLRAVRCSGSGD